MERTPEQLAEIERQRAVDPTARGIHIELTPEQRNEYQRLAKAVDAGQESDRAHVRAIEAAAREPGFSGDLRRAIMGAGIPIAELSARCGISATTMEEFRAARLALTSDAIDRLIEALGLQLTATSSQ